MIGCYCPIVKLHVGESAECGTCAEARGRREEHERCVRAVRAQLTAAVLQNKRFRKALEFYQNPKAWREAADNYGHVWAFDWPGDLAENPWEIAQRALGTWICQDCGCEPLDDCWKKCECHCLCLDEGVAHSPCGLPCPIHAAGQ